MYLLGIDLGSSSIKVSIVSAVDQVTLATAQSPSTEMEMITKAMGWAEQEPMIWWRHTCKAIKQCIASAKIDGKNIRSIGIAYQMHGLVLIDKNHDVLRPSIIWCDSRAIDIGAKAFSDLGEEHCLQNYLNSPGNFTASKLKWVQENEPELYRKIYKLLLPGDYINMMLTGEINTTISGLSEGVMWNFKGHKTAEKLLDYYNIDQTLIPEVVNSISRQGQLKKEVAKELGLSHEVIVGYRAGDQPNNAMSLGVLEPNQVAATGGTSGVIYGVVDQYIYDQKSRVNGFAHVNHTENKKRIGILLCINGAGIQYAWIKKQIALDNLSYNDIEKLIQNIPIGADGLTVIPFGNGSERMLENKSPGASISNLQFNIHTKEHLYRAALEGIAFSFAYGFELLKDLGLHPNIIKVGNDNLFRSEVFSNTVSTLLDTTIEIVDTNGAVGAAKASGIITGVYKNLVEAMSSNQVEKIYLPSDQSEEYENAYRKWKSEFK